MAPPTHEKATSLPADYITPAVLPGRIDYREAVDRVPRAWLQQQRAELLLGLLRQAERSPDHG